MSIKTRSTSLSTDHVTAALEGYMRSMSMIDDNEIIVGVKKSPRSTNFEVIVESDNNED